MNESNVKREDIVAAYRMFLGREPENDEVVDKRIGAYTSLAELGRAFATSREFQDRFKMNDAAMSGAEAPIHIQETVAQNAHERLVDYIHDVWSDLGRKQAHWSVLSVDEFKSADLDDDDLDRFYETGARDTQIFLSSLRRNGIEPDGLSSCLDIGCGVGRVALHLAQYFESVSGCDISEPHLKLAKARADKKDVANIGFWQLESIDDIGLRGRFDAVFSIIVLQHNPPPIIHAMIAQICKSLKDGGVAFFQVPTYIEGYRFDLAEYESALSQFIEMHCVHQASVLATCGDNECAVLEILEDSRTGYKPHERSNTFVIQKVAKE